MKLTCKTSMKNKPTKANRLSP